MSNHRGIFIHPVKENMDANNDTKAQAKPEMPSIMKDIFKEVLTDMAGQTLRVKCVDFALRLQGITNSRDLVDAAKQIETYITTSKEKADAKG